MENQVDIKEIISAVKRRFKPAIVIWLLVFCCSIAYAVLAKPTFRSQSTILIEQQEIPQELVRSTVTSFADQRIQMIIQRVMTFSKLSEIIKKYDLYVEERQKDPLEVVIDQMREDINHRMISAEVVDPRSGRPVEATIAFSIGYQNKSPKLAQSVANELTSLFLSENIKTRNEMAQEAEAFLSNEVERLERRSTELEASLAEFKEENLRKLPELTQLNMSTLERTEREYFEINRQIKSLEERKLYIESQLSLQDPQSSVVSNGDLAVLTPSARAKLLQNKYISLLASYSESHPDVVKVKRELDNLVGDGDYPNDKAFLQKQIDLYQTELSKAEAKYGEKHPEIQRLHAAIQNFKLQLKQADKTYTAELESDNPTYVQLATSLKTADLELQHLKASRIEVKQKLDELESALLEAPKVEKEYRALTRDYENTSMKYRELKAKQLEAGLAKALESESKGERFTLIEPPLMPEKPVKPNRRLIAVAGFVVALMAFSAVVFLLEKLDQTFRSPGSLSRFMGAPALVVIPHISTSEEIQTKKRYALIAGVGCVVCAIAFAVLIHVVWMPLDILWYVALRKVG